MEREMLRETMEADRERAARFLEGMKGGRCGNKDAFADCVRGYALARLSLPEEETGQEIAELAARSMARAMGVSVESFKSRDRASGCDYTTSVTDKKLLLILSLTRELGVKLSPGLAPKIKTLAQLADSLWEEMEKTCGETTSP